MIERLDTLAMLTLYARASLEDLTEVRAYVRETGLKPPKLGRLGLPLGLDGRPTLTFTFEDINHAFAFRMRFNAKVLHSERVVAMEAERRRLIVEMVEKMKLPPELAAKVEEALIEQVPLSGADHL